MIGKKLVSRYKILKKIASGGMGTVWLAYDEKNDINIALKTIKKDIISKDFKSMFKKEFEIAKQIQSPYIVKVFNFHQTKNLFFFTMEYIEGKNLREHFKKPFETLLPIFKDITKGIADLHSYNIIHMDIKPSNVMVDLNGRAKLLDFGLASIDYDLSSQNKGTFHYIAPEIFIGHKPDQRSDLYSLGILMYETMFGKLPFEIPLQMNEISKNILLELKFPKNTIPEIQFIIKSLINPFPENRIKDAISLLAKLRHISALLKSNNSSEKRIVEIVKTDFIGRRIETLQLMNDIDNFIITGISDTIAVTGVKGVGKTRFLREVEQKTTFRKIDPFFISASRTNDLSLTIFKEIWKKADREYRFQIAMKWGSLIVFYYPELKKYNEFKTLKSIHSLQSTKENFSRLVAMFNDVLELVSQKNKLLLIIDNFDDSDDKSRDIIKELISKNNEKTSLFLILSFTEEISNIKPELLASTTITIPEFNISETRDFMEFSLNVPSDSISETFVKWVYQNSNGIVKLIKAILFMLANEKLIYFSGRAIHFESIILKDKAFDYLIEQKISSFSKNEILILQAASIYKRFTTLTALKFILKEKLSEKDFFRSYNLLKSNYFLKERKENIIKFVIDRFKNIIFNSMDKKLKEYFHLRMYQFLMLQESSLNNFSINTYSFAAYHALKANKPKEALKYYLIASSKKFFNINFEQSALMIEEALNILEKYPNILNKKQKDAVILFAANVFFEIGFFTKAVPLLEKSYKIKKTDKILENLVMSLTKNNDLKTATKEIAKFRPKDNNEKAFIHFLKAYIATKTESNFKKAKIHFSKAEELIEKGFNKLFTQERLYILKEIEFDYYLLQPETKKETLEKIHGDLFKMAKQIDSKVYLIDAFNTSFKLYWRFNDLGKCFYALKNAMKLAFEIYDNYRIARIFQNMATISHRQDKWNDVGYYLDKAMEYARKGCGTKILKNVFLNKGEYALISGDFSIAENYLINAEKLSFQDKKQIDMIAILSFQIILFVLKNEIGFARNVAAKLRRITENKQTQFFNDPYKIIAGNVSILFAEAFSIANNEVFFSISTHIEKIMNIYAQTQKTYKLFYLTSQMIYRIKNNYHQEAIEIIRKIENEEISSDYSLFRMIYYYNAALYLSERHIDDKLLNKYIIFGRQDATLYQSSDFIAKFSELSLFINKNEKDNLTQAIKKIIIKLQNGEKVEQKTIDLELNKMNLYIEESQKRLDFFRTRNNNYARIVDIMKLISGQSEILKIMEIIVDKLISEMSLSFCGIVQINQKNNENTYLIKDSTLKKYKIKEVSFNADLIKSMLHSSKIEFLANIATNNNFSLTNTLSSPSSALSFQSAVAVPILFHGEIKAYLYIERTISKGTFQEGEIQFLEILAENSGVVFDNIELLQIATTDILTKVYSRQHFLNLLEKEIEKASRYNFPLSLIMLDIDYFKKINDTYGHLAGDTVLKMLGKILKNNIRNTDSVGRYGGEEFLILLPGTTGEGAYKTAEKIRTKVEKESVLGIKTTISCGVVSFDKEKTPTSESFIFEADKAMYHSKQTGRNKTTLFELNKKKESKIEHQYKNNK